jgi:hypothetical protein
MNAIGLALEGEIGYEYMDYVERLKMIHVRTTEEEDKLV